MESLEFYWDYFVDVEKREFRGFLHTIRYLSLGDEWLVPLGAEVVAHPCDGIAQPALAEFCDRHRFA